MWEEAHYRRGELTVFPDEHMRRRISWQPQPLTIESWSSVTEVGSSLFNLELSWDTPDTSPLKTGIQTDSSFHLCTLCQHSQLQMRKHTAITCFILQFVSKKKCFTHKFKKFKSKKATFELPFINMALTLTRFVPIFNT